MSLEIVELYGYAAAQGAPNPGRRAYGVPPGGAFDQESFRLANTLLGNPPDALSLELCTATVVFRATSSLTLSIVGAAVEATLDGSTIACGRSHALRAGQVLSMKPAPLGVRTYIGLPGLPLLAGRRVHKGQPIPLVDSAPRAESRTLQPPASLTHGPLRITCGAQADYFPRECLAFNRFKVSSAADRVGVRLQGSEITGGPEMTSEPACPGAVQVGGDGQLIILGPDGPTIAGYPKIAVVIRADMNRVAQLKPGDFVDFEYVSLEQARGLDEANDRRIEAACAEIRIRGTLI